MTFNSISSYVCLYLDCSTQEKAHEDTQDSSKPTRNAESRPFRKSSHHAHRTACFPFRVDNSQQPVAPRTLPGNISMPVSPVSTVVLPSPPEQQRIASPPFQLLRRHHARVGILVPVSVRERVLRQTVFWDFADLGGIGFEGVC